MLHFSENNQADKNDRQAKIRPLLFVLENNFQTIYTLGPNIVIDETMVPWRGRLLFKQYIPGKKHKYGVNFLKFATQRVSHGKYKFTQENPKTGKHKLV
nr:unnamed protein product [Callosobruchus chinensis]CAH7769575.1 unnamed protein product [Callosobruchus chinensis]